MIVRLDDCLVEHGELTFPELLRGKVREVVPPAEGLGPKQDAELVRELEREEVMRVVHEPEEITTGGACSLQVLADLLPRHGEARMHVHVVHAEPEELHGLAVYAHPRSIRARVGAGSDVPKASPYRHSANVSGHLQYRHLWIRRRPARAL